MAIESLKQGWEMQLVVLEGSEEEMACPECFSPESMCTCMYKYKPGGVNFLWPTHQVVIKLKGLIGIGSNE